MVVKYWWRCAGVVKFYQEFHNQYGHKINTATRPYSFIEFDTYIQKVNLPYCFYLIIINLEIPRHL